MKGYITSCSLLLKWSCLIFFSLLLSLSACSEYEHSIYDPLSSEYVDLPTPVGQEVDLGLTVNWANHNVGATAPEEYGGYYAWGETKMKHEYTEGNYFYRSDNGYVNIGSDISGTSYDVARVRWGGDWRMPTYDEIKELQDKCSWEFAEVNGVSGRKVIGPNGNSIFLPATGLHDTELVGRGLVGWCWCGTIGDGYSNNVYIFGFGRDVYSAIMADYRYIGMTVRPVKSKTHKERTIAETYEAGGGYTITRGVVIATSKQELIINNETRRIPVLVDEEACLNKASGNNEIKE